MKKVFLYLYPIEEYTKMFLFSDDRNYDEWNIKRPLPVIDECIQKRYRDNDYEIVFALYPDRQLFGLTKKEDDKIIYTDILVVGGYHANDCVKRVAEVSNELGIDTLIDLDLTDFFFNLYRKEDYFKIDEYSPNRYYNYMKSKALEYHEDNFEDGFKKTFASPVYGFYKENNDKLRR